MYPAANLTRTKRSGYRYYLQVFVHLLNKVFCYKFDAMEFNNAPI